MERGPALRVTVLRSGSCHSFRTTAAWPSAAEASDVPAGADVVRGARVSELALLAGGASEVGDIAELATAGDARAAATYSPVTVCNAPAVTATT